MPILPNENRAVVQSLEQSEGLPPTTLQALVEKRTGWRPNLNFLPDFMLPEEDRGDNTTEQEVVAQNMAGARQFKLNLNMFGNNTPLATHAFLYGAEQTENGLKNGFSQREVDDVFDVALRSKAIAGEEVRDEEVQALANQFGGMPSERVVNRARPAPPAPQQPVSLKRADNGTYYTGDPLYDAILKIESGGRADAVSPTGAKGLFQFTRGTGEQYGIYGGRRGDIRADPQANFLAMKRLTRDNINYLRRHNVPINPTTIYLAHQQGAGGMAQLWGAMNGTGELSDKVRSNMGINWGDTSAQEYYRIAESKMNEALGGRQPTGDYGGGVPMDISGTSAEGDQPQQNTSPLNTGEPIQATDTTPTPDYMNTQNTGAGIGIQDTGLDQARNLTATTAPPSNSYSENQRTTSTAPAISNGQQNPAQSLRDTATVTAQATSGIKNVSGINNVKDINWKALAKEAFKPKADALYTDNNITSAIKGVVKNIL